MQIITHEELKQKLDRGDDFKLVMTMHEIYFQKAHIPGSLNIFQLEDALTLLHPEDEIVVYCVDEQCIASITAYHILDQHGYQQVRRFAGGLSVWAQAGYPLNGETGETATGETVGDFAEKAAGKIAEKE
jgi:rhodanese-related sulfurtransferase